MRPTRLILLLLALLTALPSLASAQDDPQTRPDSDDRAANAPLRVAIFVKNRAEEVPDAKVSVLEDLVTAKVTDAGFAVIRREDVLNAVSAFADAGPNAGANSEVLDRVLSDNTSALRLAQNLNADYLLTVSMSTFGENRYQFDDGNLQSDITEYTLRTSVAILDRLYGASQTADFVEATERTRQSAGLRITRDVVDDLLATTAEKVADVLQERREADAIPQVAQMPADDEFSVNATITGLEFPELVRDENGDYTVTTNTLPLQVFDVVVELDGVAIGSTPGPFQATPGLHKLRLRREGFEDWEGTVNVRLGQPLRISMRPTGEFRRELLEAATFFEGLKRDAKLTDAQVEIYKGFAEFLRNSGINLGLKFGW